MGYKHTEETLAKMREAKKGNKHPLFGKTHSKETLNRMSAALKGKNNPLFGITPSEETKTKISVALGTAIEVFDMKTEVTSVYTSIRQAAESIGCVHGTILLALKSSRAIKKRYLIKIVQG